MRYVLLLACALGLHAQDQYLLRPGGVEAGFEIGGITQTQSVSDAGYKPSGAINVGVGLTNRVKLGLRFTTAAYNNDVTLNQKSYTVKSLLVASMGEVRYEFRNQRIRPYLTGGIGGLQFRNITTTATDAQFNSIILNDLNLQPNWQLATGIGGGINANINKNIGIGFNLRAIKGQHTHWLYQPTIGLYYQIK